MVDSISRLQVPFSVSTPFSIAALSASEATILRSARRTPLRRHLLISAMASDKATELGDEVTVVVDGEGPVASDDGNHIRSSKQVRRIRARKRKGSDGFSRHEPNQPLAALADCTGAFAPDMRKEGVLLGAIELPETEIVLVDGGHFSVPLLALAQKPSASQPPKHV